MSNQHANPLVSVVVTTYNRPELARRAIQSVINQDYPALDIIVVEDGSQSDLPEWISSRGLNVRYHRHEKNMGLAAARNTGLRLAKGKYVSYLDDDDEWQSCKITRQVAAMLESGGSCEVMCTACWFIDDYGKSLKKSTITGNIKESIEKNGLSVLPDNTGLFLKRALADIGGYDEELRSHTEYALWMRMAQKGYSAASIDEPMLIVYQHAEWRVTGDLGARSLATDVFIEKWYLHWELWYGRDRAKKLRREFWRSVNLGLAEGLMNNGNIRQGFYYYRRAVCGPAFSAGACVSVMLSFFRVCLRRMKLYGITRSAWQVIRRGCFKSRN